MQHGYIPYYTDQLRQLLIELGFKAVSYTPNKAEIIYTHPIKDPTENFVILIPVVNVINKHFAGRVLDDLIEKYNFSHMEIFQAADRLNLNEGEEEV